MKACCETYLNGQFAGEREIIDEIYSEYVKSIDEKLTEAEQALAARSWGALDRAAHTIKGNALAVGDTEMAETAIELRTCSQLSDVERSAELIAMLRGFSTTL